MALEAIVFLGMMAIANHPFATGLLACLFAFGWWQMGVAMAYNEIEIRKSVERNQ